MKEYNEQIMKFKITKNKLKMEIKLSDLAWLLKNSPSNVSDDGEGEYCHVRKGKNQEFAEYIVKALMEDSQNERDCVKWGEPFEDIFEEIMESCEDEFIKYNND